MSLQGAVNDVLKILGVAEGSMEEEAREERRRRKRAAYPSRIETPGCENNRAARRLAAKNRMPTGTFLAMKKAKLVAQGERRIDKKKMRTFVEATRAARRLMETSGPKEIT